MTSLGQILGFLLGLAWWVIIIQAIMSWLISFNVLNVRQPFIYQIWSGLNAMTEPIYRKIRPYLPSTGGLDFAPLIVLIAIMILQTLVRNNL
ncbi:MAG: YggT family protein [Pseudomonadota bacterium]